MTLQGPAAADGELHPLQAAFVTATRRRPHCMPGPPSAAGMLVRSGRAGRAASASLTGAARRRGRDPSG